MLYEQTRPESDGRPAIRSWIGRGEVLRGLDDGVAGAQRPQRSFQRDEHPERQGGRGPYRSNLRHSDAQSTPTISAIRSPMSESNSGPAFASFG
jgi:hypothetical protein